MSPLSMLFQTLLNPFKILMKIFNSLVLFFFFSLNLCVLLTLDTGHLRIPALHEGAEVSAPLRNKRWWHSDSYSVRGIAKFVSPMYKHTPFCYWTVYIYTSRLTKPAAFSRTAECFQSHIYAAHRS